MQQLPEQLSKRKYSTPSDWSTMCFTATHTHHSELVSLSGESVRDVRTHGHARFSEITYKQVYTHQLHRGRGRGARTAACHVFIGTHRNHHRESYRELRNLHESLHERLYQAFLKYLRLHTHAEDDYVIVGKVRLP